jgi:hypothetical protein
VPLAALLALLLPVMLADRASSTTTAGSDCTSVVRPLGGGRIDLAPPHGFVEICAEDAALCRTLTAKYPPSVTTLGYFVPAAEWASRAKEGTPSFARYLIAQVAPHKTAAQLPEVKSFVRSQQHGLPDRAELAETLRRDGQASLGVLADTPDSISIGAVSAAPGEGTAPAPLLAMTNSALAIGRDMLSLYVYGRIAGPQDVPQIEALTARWLRCLRDANRPSAQGQPR